MGIYVFTPGLSVTLHTHPLLHGFPAQGSSRAARGRFRNHCNPRLPVFQTLHIKWPFSQGSSQAARGSAVHGRRGVRAGCAHAAAGADQVGFLKIVASCRNVPCLMNRFPRCSWGRSSGAAVGAKHTGKTALLAAASAVLPLLLLDLLTWLGTMQPDCQHTSHSASRTAAPAILQGRQPRDAAGGGGGHRRQGDWRLAGALLACRAASAVNLEQFGTKWLLACSPAFPLVLPLCKQVTDLGIARDTAANVEAALDRAIAAGADVLLTTGTMRCLQWLLERRGPCKWQDVLLMAGAAQIRCVAGTGWHVC